MQILIGRVFHTCTESTLKMSKLGQLCFSFCRGCMVKKRRHHSAGRTAVHMFHEHYSTRDWIVHILGKSYFCAKKALYPVQSAWNWVQFDHVAAPIGFRFSIKEYCAIWRILLSWCVFILKQCAVWLRIRAILQCSKHSSAHSGSCVSGSWKLRCLCMMRDFSYSWITEQPITVRGPFSRDTHIAPKPCFSK